MDGMNPDFLMMGWTPATYWVMVWSNIAIALCYYFTAWEHFRSALTSEHRGAHVRYGLFIIACGGSHFAMAGHFLWTLEVLNTFAHALTAVVSVVVCLVFPLIESFRRTT